MRLRNKCAGYTLQMLLYDSALAIILLKATWLDLTYLSVKAAVKRHVGLFSKNFAQNVVSSAVFRFKLFTTHSPLNIRGKTTLEKFWHSRTISMLLLNSFIKKRLIVKLGVHDIPFDGLTIVSYSWFWIVDAIGHDYLISALTQQHSLYGEWCRVTNLRVCRDNETMSLELVADRHAWRSDAILPVSYKYIHQ